MLLLACLLRIFTSLWTWEPLYYAKDIMYAITMLTTQLNALIAQVLTNRRSRKKLKDLYRCFRLTCAKNRVGMFTMVIRTSGNNASQTEN